MCDVLDKVENRGESKVALLMKKLFDQNRVFMAIAASLRQSRALTVKSATSRPRTRLPISCRKPIPAHPSFARSG